MTSPIPKRLPFPYSSLEAKEEQAFLSLNWEQGSWEDLYSSTWSWENIVGIQKGLYRTEKRGGEGKGEEERRKEERRQEKKGGERRKEKGGGQERQGKEGDWENTRAKICLGLP